MPPSDATEYTSPHSQPMSEKYRNRFHRKVITENGVYALEPRPWPADAPPPNHPLYGHRPGIDYAPAIWVMGEGRPDRPEWGEDLDRIIAEGYHVPEAGHHNDRQTFDPYKHEDLRRHLLRPLTWDEYYRSGLVEPPPGADAHPYDWQARLVFADWLDEHHADTEDRFGHTVGEEQRRIADHIRRRPDRFSVPASPPPAEPPPLDPDDTDEHGDPYARTNYADDHTVSSLMAQLGSPELTPHRWGRDDPLSGLRGVLADALEERGRLQEADLLRSPGRHVTVIDGRVLPARPVDPSGDYHAAVDAARRAGVHSGDWAHDWDDEAVTLRQSWWKPQTTPISAGGLRSHLAGELDRIYGAERAAAGPELAGLPPSHWHELEDAIRRLATGPSDEPEPPPVEPPLDPDRTDEFGRPYARVDYADGPEPHVVRTFHPDSNGYSFTVREWEPKLSSRDTLRWEMRGSFAATADEVRNEYPDARPHDEFFPGDARHGQRYLGRELTPEEEQAALRHRLGQAPADEEQLDWRPSESLPEDFWAMSRYAASFTPYADQATVQNLLAQLRSPEHDETRWGTGGDAHLRGVAADALQDLGRDDEAQLLRDPTRHVLIDDRGVRPGRFSSLPAMRELYRLSRAFHEAGLTHGPRDLAEMHDWMDPHIQQLPDDHGVPHGHVRFRNIDTGDAMADMPHHELPGYLADYAQGGIEDAADENGNLPPDLLQGLADLRNAPFEEEDSGPDPHAGSLMNRPEDEQYARSDYTLPTPRYTPDGFLKPPGRRLPLRAWAVVEGPGHHLVIPTAVSLEGDVHVWRPAPDHTPGGVRRPGYEEARELAERNAERFGEAVVEPGPDWDGAPLTNDHLWAFNLSDGSGREPTPEGWTFTETNPEDFEDYTRSDYADEREFTDAIRDEPLDTTRHRVYADWLQEQRGEGHPDERFRRTLADSVDRRLSGWKPPKFPDGGASGFMTRPEYGVMVRGTPSPQYPDTSRWVLYNPYISPAGRDLSGRWVWGTHSSDHLPSDHPAFSHPDGTPLPMWADWHAERLLNKVPWWDREAHRVGPDNHVETSLMSPAELWAAGVTDPANVHPELWPQIEALTRDRFDRGLRFDDPAEPVEYADEREGFRQSIARDPLDATTHRVFADFLEEQNDPEAPFRRAVGDALHRRLSTPWKGPEFDDNGQLIDRVRPGPSDNDYNQQVIVPRGSQSVDWHSMVPSIVRREYRPTWMAAGYPEDSIVWDSRFMSVGRHPRDERHAGIPTLAEWREARLMSAPGSSAPPGCRWRLHNGVVQGAQLLTPAEHWFAGIEDPGSLDPAVWPYVEEIMKARFGRGQYLESGEEPTEYADADERRAFIAGLAQHPDDPIDSLVFADWLQDRGDPLAEVVRRHAEAGAGGRPSSAAPGQWAGRRFLHGGPIGGGKWRVTGEEYVPNPTSHLSGAIGADFDATFDPHEADKANLLARQLLDAGYEPHGGSYWQHGFDGRFGAHSNQDERIYDQAAAARIERLSRYSAEAPMTPYARYDCGDCLDDLRQKMYALKQLFEPFGEDPPTSYDTDYNLADQRAFEEALDRNPLDATTHGAYADWLREQEVPRQALVHDRMFAQAARMRWWGSRNDLAGFRDDLEEGFDYERTPEQQDRDADAWKRDHGDEDWGTDYDAREPGWHGYPERQREVMPGDAPRHTIPATGEYTGRGQFSVGPTGARVFGRPKASETVYPEPRRPFGFYEDVGSSLPYAHGPTGQALFTGVMLHPDDEAQRQAYIDWLYENGMEDEADRQRDRLNDLMARRGAVPPQPTATVPGVAGLLWEAAGRGVLGTIEPGDEDHYTRYADFPEDFRLRRHPIWRSETLTGRPGFTTGPTDAGFVGLPDNALDVPADLPLHFPEYEPECDLRRAAPMRPSGLDDHTRYGDEDNFRAAIGQNPLDLTAHGAFADFLGDTLGEDHPETIFRRKLHESMDRRLNTWRPPFEIHPNGALLDTAGYLGPIQPERIWMRPDVPGAAGPAGEFNTHLYHPTVTEPQGTGQDPYWWWGWEAAEPGISGFGRLEDVMPWEYPEWDRRRSEEPDNHNTHRLRPHERVYHGIDNPETIDPKIWPQLEALMRRQHGRGLPFAAYAAVPRDDFGRVEGIMQEQDFDDWYDGRWGHTRSPYAYSMTPYADEDTFRRLITEAPLDLTNHGVYADWLEEQGRSDDATFRRAVMGNLERRLGTPWKRPAVPQGEPFTGGPHAPIDPARHEIFHPAYVNSFGTQGPTANLVVTTWPHREYGDFWGWDPYGPDRRTAEPGDEALPTPREFARMRRAGHMLGVVPDSFMHEAEDLTEAERFFAGLRPIKKVRPELWSQVEDLMRAHHNKGLRLARYSQSGEPVRPTAPELNTRPVTSAANGHVSGGADLDRRDRGPGEQTQYAPRPPHHGRKVKRFATPPVGSVAVPEDLQLHGPAGILPPPQIAPPDHGPDDVQQRVKAEIELRRAQMAPHTARMSRYGMTPYNREAFLAAIHANPHDETAQRVFADWLDEQGQSEEAKDRRKLADWMERHRAGQGKPIRIKHGDEYSTVEIEEHDEDPTGEDESGQPWAGFGVVHWGPDHKGRTDIYDESYHKDPYEALRAARREDDPPANMSRYDATHYAPLPPFNPGTRLRPEGFVARRETRFPGPLGIGERRIVTGRKPWTNTALRERRAFENIIAAEPDDEVARMVYADWLRDRGEHDLATMVLPGYDPTPPAPPRGRLTPEEAMRIWAETGTRPDPDDYTRYGDPEEDYYGPAEALAERDAFTEYGIADWLRDRGGDVGRHLADQGAYHDPLAALMTDAKRRRPAESFSSLDRPPAFDPDDDRTEYADAWGPPLDTYPGRALGPKQMQWEQGLLPPDRGPGIIGDTPRPSSYPNPIAPTKPKRRSVSQLPEADSLSGSDFGDRTPRSGDKAISPQSRIDAWARGHADRHADALAQKFGWDRDYAHRVLTHAIRSTATQVGKTGTGVRGAGTFGGKRIKINIPKMRFARYSAAHAPEVYSFEVDEPTGYAVYRPRRPQAPPGWDFIDPTPGDGWWDPVPADGPQFLPELPLFDLDGGYFHAPPTPEQEAEYAQWLAQGEPFLPPIPDDGPQFLARYASEFDDSIDSWGGAHGPMFGFQPGEFGSLHRGGWWNQSMGRFASPWDHQYPGDERPGDSMNVDPRDDEGNELDRGGVEYRADYTSNLGYPERNEFGQAVWHFVHPDGRTAHVAGPTHPSGEVDHEEDGDWEASVHDGDDIWTDSEDNARGWLLDQGFRPRVEGSFGVEYARGFL